MKMSKFHPDYEYNAPRFCDFGSYNELDDPNVEEYFAHDHESGKRVSALKVKRETVSVSEWPASSAESIATMKQEMQQEENAEAEETSSSASRIQNRYGKDMLKAEASSACSMKSEPTVPSVTEQNSTDHERGVPSNLVTSWNNVAIGKSSVEGEDKRLKGHVTHQQSVQGMKGSGSAHNSRGKASSTQGTPVRVSARLAATAAANQRQKSLPTSKKGTSIGRTKSSYQGSSSSRSSIASRRRSKSSIGSFSTRTTKLTIPETPQVLRRAKAKLMAQKANLKSTEDLELEKVAEMKRQMAYHKKMVEATYKMVKGTKGPVAVKPTHRIPTTQTEEFHFATDARLKEHTMETRQDTACKDFTESLRAYKSSDCQMPKLTEPVPFQLRGSRKRKFEADQTEKFVSMAEKFIQFQNATPERFRSQPKSGASCIQNYVAQPKQASLKLTIPKTPSLQSKSRARQVHTISREQQEELELEEMKKHQFKAHPINDHVLAGPVHTTAVECKATTVPQPFNLTEVKKKEVVEEEPPQFHARPVPRAILDGPVGLGSRKNLPLTQPESPAFALKDRIGSRQKVLPVVEEQNEKPRGWAKTVPHSGVPFKPVLEKKTTDPEPFSFEQRTREMMQKKEQKIQQVLEEERKAREFHAKPILSLNPCGIPEKHTVQATRPEPFQLSADERGKIAAEKWQRTQMEDELEQQRLAAQFKARPARVLQQEPFVPKKDGRVLSDVTTFKLNTEKRFREREEFELHKKSREAELEGEKREREVRMEKEKQEAILKLRQESVHKAQPIHLYKPLLIQPSEKPLTQPLSPNFSDRFQK